MSFFQQEGDDSHLQYDDAAFLYFIATVAIVGAIGVGWTIASDLLGLRLRGLGEVAKSAVFKEKMKNLRRENRRKIINGGFLKKVALFLVLVGVFVWVHRQSAGA
jgi:amino acid transporter